MNRKNNRCTWTAIEGAGFGRDDDKVLVTFYPFGHDEGRAVSKLFGIISTPELLRDLGKAFIKVADQVEKQNAALKPTATEASGKAGEPQ